GDGDTRALELPAAASPVSGGVVARAAPVSTPIATSVNAPTTVAMGASLDTVASSATDRTGAASAGVVRSGEPVDGGEGSGEGSTGAGTDGAGTRVRGSDVPGTDVVGTDAVGTDVVGTDVSETCRWLGFGCG